MLLSWGILFSWRETLVNQEESHALAVSRAFSVAVIDALIYAELDLYRSEGFLDNYVTLFMEENPRLRSITILDPAGAVVARSWDRSRPPWVSRHPARAGGGGRAPHHRGRPRTTAAGSSRPCCPCRRASAAGAPWCWASRPTPSARPIRRSFILLALLTAAVTSIMLLLLWLMLGRLLGSLRSLVDAMDAVDLAGMPPAPLPPRADEIGVLYRHFEHMQPAPGPVATRPAGRPAPGLARGAPGRHRAPRGGHRPRDQQPGQRHPQLRLRHPQRASRTGSRPAPTWT